jgi:hypothetical protein
MKPKEFNNILNDCLERLLIKGESLEQCLEHYPGQADELKPLLETALEAREASAIQPRPDFRARARYQFRSALEEMAAGKGRPFWGWFPGWATVVAVVLVLVLGGGGTVFAAGSSMPDSPLYSVKLATEEARLSLTLSQMGKARLCAETADQRVEEIAYMAEKGEAEQVELITRRLDDRLGLLVVLIEGRGGINLPGMLLPAAEAPPPTLEETPPPTTTPPQTAPLPTDEAAHPPVAIPPPEKAWGGGGDSRVQLRNTLTIDAVLNQATLRQVLDEAPEPVKPALLEAIAVSEDGYQAALEALEQY